MERKTHEPMLIDGMTADLGDPQTINQLEQLNRVIPWEKLAQPIRQTYQNDTAKGGRPNVPVVMMLKIVMLQKWFNLSDPAAEAMLRDRISFRKFVGLGWTDPTVDHATIAIFRGRLREQQLMSDLFDQVTDHLSHEGMIVREGTLVDATIISAPRGRSTDSGTGHTKDKAATSTKKNSIPYHGYKAHIATDTQGMIIDYVYDTAKVHDSKHIDQLIEDEDQAVYADSAYMDKNRKERLENDGVFCGIIQRRVRGQKELTVAQKQHNKQCAQRRARVEHPFAWIKEHGRLFACPLPGAPAQCHRLCFGSDRLQFQTQFITASVRPARSLRAWVRKTPVFRRLVSKIPLILC